MIACMNIVLYTAEVCLNIDVLGPLCTYLQTFVQSAVVEGHWADLCALVTRNSNFLYNLI